MAGIDVRRHFRNLTQPGRVDKRGTLNLKGKVKGDIEHDGDIRIIGGRISGDVTSLSGDVTVLPWRAINDFRQQVKQDASIGGDIKAAGDISVTVGSIEGQVQADGNVSLLGSRAEGGVVAGGHARIANSDTPSVQAGGGVDLFNGGATRREIQEVDAGGKVLKSGGWNIADMTSASAELFPRIAEEDSAGDGNIAAASELGFLIAGSTNSPGQFPLGI